MWISGVKGLICGCLDPQSIFELFSAFDSKMVFRSMTKFIPEIKFSLLKIGSLLMLWKLLVGLLLFGGVGIPKMAITHYLSELIF